MGCFMVEKLGAATGWAVVLLAFCLFEAGAYYFCPIPFLKWLLISVFTLAMALLLLDIIRVIRKRPSN